MSNDSNGETIDYKIGDGTAVWPYSVPSRVYETTAPKMEFKESDKITEEDLKGGYKADEGKPRVGLIPPDVLIEVAKLYTMGAKKYSANNWRLGMDYNRPYDALQRHALAWWSGEDLDPIDGQNHLTSIIWNAMTLLYFQLHEDKYKQFDNRDEEPVRAADNGQK